MLWGSQSRDLQKLQAEAGKLNHFRAEGIVQISYSQLALRKNFVFAKDDRQMRMDIIEGGVMGMQAEPLFSLYFGSYIALKSPLMPQLEQLDLSRYLPPLPQNLSLGVDSLLAVHQAEILANKVIDTDELKIKFSKDYRITYIEEKDSKTTIEISYTRKGDIDTIVVKQEEKQLLSMLIDKISYELPEITPLPRSTIKTPVSDYDLFFDR